MKTNFKKSKLALFVGATLLAASPLSFAASVDLDNAGFEDKWDNWDTNKAAISTSDSYSGSRSGKLTSTKGRIEREVSVEKYTTYTLSAYVLDGGRVGADVGDDTYSDEVKSDDWTKVTVEFDSGSESTITIFGEYYKKKNGRFDDFSLESSASETPEPTEPEVDPSEPETEPTQPSTGTCDSVSELSIAKATDNGNYEGSHKPSKLIDGDTSDDSRWSSEGTDAYVTLELDDTYLIDELSVKWFKGSSRNYYFDLAVSTDKSEWTTVTYDIETSKTSDFEGYELGGISARYVRVRSDGNSSNDWNSMIEANLYGCASNGEEVVTPDPEDEVVTPDPEDEVVTPDPVTPIDDDYGLNPSLPPSDNFDLVDWYLSVPTDTDDNGKADSIKEDALNEGYESEFFYTGSDGGMVFKCPVDGYKTSTSTTYTRSELREMLRQGKTSIDTSYDVDKDEDGNGRLNNWAFSSIKDSDEDEFGGIDGLLTATVAVNHVTTTSNDEQVGRVIIGQIHAANDEPARLYYRLLPGHTKGSVYLAHEPADGHGSEQWYELIGSRDDDASEPSDGIKLDEKFTYTIKVEGRYLTVTIIRDGYDDVSEKVDMVDSGFADSENYMYYKAGVYNQSKTGDGDDYVQATFYRLTNTHDNYKDSE